MCAPRTPEVDSSACFKEPDVALAGEEVPDLGV